MKKSKITVSMPLTTFQTLSAEKEEYEKLVIELRGCFNTEVNPAEFNSRKAFVIAKKFLSARHQDKNFIIIEKE